MMSEQKQTRQQMKDEFEEKVKTEDVMVSIEKTINDAYKKFGKRFEKLLEEKMNEIKEESCKAVESKTKL